MQKYFVILLSVSFLFACTSSKDLAKLAQKQVIVLQPNPLELHGGQVRGKLQIQVPAELQKKIVEYEGQVIFSSTEFTGEILRIAPTKSMAKIDTSFAFKYVPNQTEYGDILLKATLKQKKDKKYEVPSFSIGRGVITTALLFQQSAEPSLRFYALPNLPQNQEVVVFFEMNSAELSESEKSKLSQLPQPPLKITGYFSPEGNEAKNYTLAQNRANSVRNFLQNAKIEAQIEKLDFAKWKQYLQTQLDDNLKTQTQNANGVGEIYNILQKNNAESIYPNLRVARVLPVQENKNTQNALKDTAQWVSMWEKEIEKNPNDYNHHQVGTWYAQKFLQDKNEQNFQKAVYHLQTAMNLGGKAETFYNYAYLLKRKNLTQKADSLLQTATTKGATDTLLLQWLNEWQGLQKVKQATSAKDKNYQEALAFFEKSGSSVQSRFNQALVHLLTYQYDKASQILEKIQDFPLALYVRAIAGMRKGNEQECVEWLKKAVEKDKNLKTKAQKDMEFWQVREKIKSI
ncbi:MAG: OmpA family protein [Raineya sp.]|nr:OmpA family protein [Raineya sp.]MDW8296187.1 OmpA family protein [Raineya sp.]